MLYTEADLQIGRIKIKRGSYSLWLYVDTRWKLIINDLMRAQRGLLNGYDEGHDVGRVQMDMNKSPAPIEQFRISLTEEAPDLLKLQMEWENAIASAPIVVR
jgi:hypothetical protein